MGKTVAWSCGGGRQSVGIGVLIVRGDLPKPDIAVIVDTERENSSTWRYYGETLQPAASPSDAEQLSELRKESLKGICVYCGEIQQYESLEQKSGDEGNQIRITHIRQCPQRPELKLIAYCEELQEAANTALRWIARVSNQYILGADDPHEVLAQLNRVLTPKHQEEKETQ